jgi:hypothetical protein
MKTSVSKLLANRANALKSTGPKSQHGKHASSKNAHKHGLAGSLSDGERAPSLLNAELVNDARRLGYSHEDAVALIDALQTNRSVILAKHAAYAEKPIEDRMPNMSMEKIDELLYKEVEKDNDSVRRLTLKIDAHRKLMRYEQRAVNRLRRAAKGQK